ncbi:hypothetical protein [Oryza sativa Japonica Group]|uniref:Uncharacterized protein n=1 Tax=Oryza sativa subsp. japonica TaxID=39947 RepID=Q93WM6_ORYSJ|nr:hypothetical protein [Oryza sativa Japonica Group]BAB64684.1 hypothetical protein [Oryza sativa Japonica Group]
MRVTRRRRWGRGDKEAATNDREAEEVEADARPTKMEAEAAAAGTVERRYGERGAVGEVTQCGREAGEVAVRAAVERGMGLGEELLERQEHLTETPVPDDVAAVGNNRLPQWVPGRPVSAFVPGADAASSPCALFALPPQAAASPAAFFNRGAPRQAMELAKANSRGEQCLGHGARRRSCRLHDKLEATCAASFMSLPLHGTRLRRPRTSGASVAASLLTPVAEMRRALVVAGLSSSLARPRPPEAPLSS